MIVYMATCAQTGKSYIGASVRSLKSRMREHKSNAKRQSSNCAFHFAIREHGFDSFLWSVLAEVSDRELLHLIEQEAVSKFNTSVSGNGYNMTDGGLGVPGFSPTPESRAKIAAVWRGRSHTIETRAKLSASQKGRPGNPKALAAAMATVSDPVRIAKGLATRRALGLIDKFSPHTLNMMRAARLSGRTYQEIADQFGCARSHAFKLLRGLRKRGEALS